jgi:hypothetical protein
MRNIHKPKPFCYLIIYLKKPQNTMKFKRRHGEFEQGCVLSKSYTATDTLPLILPACRQPLLPACVFVTQDTFHHPRHFLFGKFVREPICSWWEAFVNHCILFFVNILLWIGTNTKTVFCEIWVQNTIFWNFIIKWSNVSTELKIQFFEIIITYFNSLSVPLKIVLRATLDKRAIGCRCLI